MKKRLFFGLIMSALVGVMSFSTAHAAPNVTCTNPSVTAAMGGGTVTIPVTCTIDDLSGLNAFISSGANIVMPSSITLRNGTNTINATLQAYITSPDGTVINLSGLPGTGFTGFLVPPTATLQFRYQAVTTSSTRAGTYTSTNGAMTFNYQIRAFPGGTFSGADNATLSVTVPAPPTSVSCNSAAANAPSGGGAFTMKVVCTIGISGTALSPGASNIFSPASLTLTNGGSSLNANLTTTVTSPDGTVSNITGTAAGGFTGTVLSLPATVQAQYSGNTTGTTRAGTYTSAPITYTWSVL